MAVLGQCQYPDSNILRRGEETDPIYCIAMVFFESCFKTNSLKNTATGAALWVIPTETVTNRNFVDNIPGTDTPLTSGTTFT